MSKYRILEKEGKIEKSGFSCIIHKDVYSRHNIDYICNDCLPVKEIYVPRFIVQESKQYDDSLCSKCKKIIHLKYNDLKEFTSLEEARAYKRSLELKEGIVHE